MAEALDEKYIQTFLKKHSQAILSTVNPKGQPDASPIYFTSKDNFEIMFVAPANSQKNINLTFNKEVLLSVTDEKENRNGSDQGQSISS